ncbi:MAG TPA: hypothetical protein VHF22_07785, partial [Planctomycetota bacterium]|nr:hypothetical protein [Planctomycetota bacterium]
PQLPPVPWAPGTQPAYVAAQQRPVRRGAQSQALSSMQLTPVWLEPVARAPVRRTRRTNARNRESSNVPLTAALVVGIIGVGAAIFIAFTSGRGSEDARASERRDRPRRVASRPVREAEDDRALAAGSAGGAAAASSGKARRPISADEEQRLKAEAEDRAQAERLAKMDPQARLEREAAALAADAEKLKERAAAEAKRREANAAKQLEKDIADEDARELRLLDDVAAKLKDEDAQGAAALMADAPDRYPTAVVKARAEVDRAGVRSIANLAELARRGLEKRKGQKEKLELGRNVVEGEVVDVSPADVTVAPAIGGRIAVPIRDLKLYEQRRLARIALGPKSGEVYAAEGCLYLYSGEIQKSRSRFEAASREGFDARAYLARADELEEARAPKGPDKRAVAQTPEPAPRPEGEPPPSWGGDGKAEPEGGSTGASAGAPKKQEGGVERLTQEMLVRIFEYAPAAFSPDGAVRFSYGFADQKRLCGDFALEGGDVRYDAEAQVLRVEGPWRRITHKAVFVGPVRVELTLSFGRPLDRASGLLLFAEDAQTRGTVVESVFGIDIADRRKGRTAARGGPPDPVDVAMRELKPGAVYKFQLTLDKLSIAGIDGANRGVLDSIDVDGAARRVGFALAGMNAQLRSVEIEGTLDLRWVAKELGKKPILR